MIRFVSSITHNFSKEIMNDILFVRTVVNLALDHCPHVPFDVRINKYTATVEFDPNHEHGVPDYEIKFQRGQIQIQNLDIKLHLTPEQEWQTPLINLMKYLEIHNCSKF